LICALSSYFLGEEIPENFESIAGFVACIEDAWGLKRLKHAKHSNPMSEFFIS